MREARRALDEAAEEASRTSWLAERHAEREGEGSGTAIQRAKLEAELAAERRHAEGAEKAQRRGFATATSSSGESGWRARRCPRWGGRATRCAASPSGSSTTPRSWRGAEDEGGGDVAAELRECSQEEFGLQGELRDASEAMTVAEVEATQLRGHRDESTAELERLGRRSRRGARSRRAGPR